MRLRVKQVLLFSLFSSILFFGHATAEVEYEILGKIRAASHKNVGRNIIDGTGTESYFSFEYTNNVLGARKSGSSKVSVQSHSSELDPQWAGLCNGMAAGVMLAASFDLIEEGQQVQDAGNWVVIGILAAGIFVWLCKKVTSLLFHFSHQYLLPFYVKDLSKVILVIGIMTPHSFGEGSGVGVSFAVSKGLSQGILVTLAIAVHNIPEGLAEYNAMLWSPIVAVPSFICADAFIKLLPLCTEVLPDAFKVASAATLSVAFMEALSTLFQGFSHDYNSEDASGFFVSLLFGLGPLLGGITLHALLIGVASGIALVLAAWRPLQLLVFKNGIYVSYITAGNRNCICPCCKLLCIGDCRSRRASANKLPTLTVFPLSIHTLQSFMSCGAVALHAFAEGLALGVAAPKAPGLGWYIVLPVSLHGFPRGAAVASCIFGATDSWHGSLAATAMIGFTAPISAVGAILAGIDYTGLDHVMGFACVRAVSLDIRKSSCGLAIGLVFANL
ncbi:hypothetical protein CIPAW_09G223100 [Carya illinoinensis]|uniref:Uncharacterized protein n=1 Tax=Carya illinoinensis TaxID=32201 RepID=A0A8T1PTF2_CARIL|nr:hypothetical protein CIPAW_09G223100 [Carya illinoinensis]